MSVLNQSGEEQVECPLCMEPLEVDDLNFFPCTCGYQICRFCWHRIRTDENGLCPACRKAYSENPADFTPLSKEQVAQLKADKRQRDQQKKAKLSESRKHLASVRVVQKNLVFVVGLPVRLADADVLKKHEYFGKFGKIHKVVINQSTSYAGSQGPSASAYVTYIKSDDALRAIQSVTNIMLDGRLIKSSLGTTKYCSHFMKNQPCPKGDCMYLHDFGDPEASFTKEQMHLGKHQEYEKKLHDALLNRAQLQQQAVPTSGQSQNSSSASSEKSEKASSNNSKQNGQKDSSWPTLYTSSTTENNGKSEKPQKSDTKSEKTKKSNQKNKNNNNTSNTNNNIENSKKNEKGVNSKNCDQQNCQTSQQSSTLSSSNSKSQESVITNCILKQHNMLEEKPTSKLNKLENGSENIGNNSLNIKTSQSPMVSESLAENLSKIQLMDDNSSFFSHNSFQKILPDADSSSYSDSSSVTPQSNILNDTLPDISSSEDWQAAFGFNSKESHQNSNEVTRCNSHHHNMLNMPNSLDIIKNIDFSEENNGSDPLVLGVLNSRYSSKHILESAQTNDIRQQQNLANYSNKMSSESNLNGLDLQMSKFFAEFKTNGYPQPPPQHHNNQNGFLTPQREPGTNFMGMNGLNNLPSNYDHLMLLQQQQQQRFDKLDPETIYNLKQQHMFQQQQQQQQQQNHHNQMQPPQQFLPADYAANYPSNNSSYTSQNNVYHRSGAPMQQMRQERPSVDDDLGFDPFHETQKALAELIESEQGVPQLRNAGLLNQSSLPNHSSSNLPSGGNQPLNGMVHPTNGSTPGGGSHLPPPPGFIQHNPSPHMNSFGSKILPFLNMSSNNQQVQNNSNGWSNNFNEAQIKGLAPVNDWMTLDPAILRSGSSHVLPQNLPLRDQFAASFPHHQNQTQQPQQPQAQMASQNGQNPNYNYSNTQHLVNGYSSTSINNYGGHQNYVNNYGNHLNNGLTGLNWFGGDLHGQISSPPGFRPTTAQAKTQEC